MSAPKVRDLEREAPKDGYEVLGEHDPVEWGHIVVTDGDDDDWKDSSDKGDVQ